MAVGEGAISVVIFSLVLIANVGGLVLMLVTVVVVVVVTEVVDVVESGSELRCWFRIVNRTNPNKLRPRSETRTSSRENEEIPHLLCLRVETCPSSDGLTG